MIKHLIMSKRLLYLIWLIILLLAAILRFWRIGATSFTFDAATVSNLAVEWIDEGRLPLRGIVSSTGFRNPPLNIYLISLPLRLSRDPLVLISFVVVLNLLAVAGTYWLGRIYWDIPVGLLAALLYAISPWAIQHSREVLGQDLLAPGVVLLMTLLLAWFQDGKRWALAGALITLAALIQIHLAAIALAPIMVILLIWNVVVPQQHKVRERLWQPLAVGVLIGILLYVPYLVADAQQGWENVRGFLMQGVRNWALQPHVFDLGLINIGGRNIHALVGPARFREFLAELSPFAYWPDRVEELLVIGATFYLGRDVFRLRTSSSRANSLLLLWLIVPLLTFFVLGVKVHLHYLIVLYPAPYLALAAVITDVYRRLSTSSRVRIVFTLLVGVVVIIVLLWQIVLVTSIYRFLDLHHTPDGWPTPVRILRETLRTLTEYASLNPGSEVIVLCKGQVPEWDECPAVWTFLTSDLPIARVMDYNDPGFRVYQEAKEVLFLLTPGESLAATELPLLAEPLPEASVPLREEQDMYRFYRIHNPYQDIALYLERMMEVEDAVLLVGRDQRRILDRFYNGDLTIYELSEPLINSETVVRSLEEVTKKHRRLLALYRTSEEIDPHGVVEKWLAAHGYPSGESWLGSVRAVNYLFGEETDWLVEQLAADFGGQIQLYEAALSTSVVPAGGLLAVRLIWQAITEPNASYSTFIQLLDSEMRVVAQRDIPLQADGILTDVWQPGQQARTQASLDLPVGIAPGAYRLIVGLYDPNTGARLAVENRDFVELGIIHVERSARLDMADLTPWRFRPEYNFGQVILVGFHRSKQGYMYAPSMPLAPGDTLDMLFLWRIIQRPNIDWGLSVRLLDQNGIEIAIVTEPLVEMRSNSQWQTGELLRSQLRLMLPWTLSSGRYRLQAIVHRLGEYRLQGWLGLGNIEVVP
jgi:4-amino-4-deoxy-L-arabinose transferase-like glycosyltransferase